MIPPDTNTEGPSQTFEPTQQEYPLAEIVTKKMETIASFLKFNRGEEIPRYPMDLFLEVSNVCDLKCAMCPSFSALNPMRYTVLKKESRGFLDIPNMTSTMDEVLAHVLMVHCFGYGEPTVHPQFKDFLHYLGQFKVLIEFITNGMHLDDAMVEELIANRIFKVVVSFSGATAEEYENMYIGGNFQRVLDNLKRLSLAKEKAGSKYPILEINSIGFKHHIEKLDTFVEMMAAHGVNAIEIKRLVEVPGNIDPLYGHHAFIREWVEGPVFERAKALAESHNIRLVNYVPIAKTEAEYEALQQEHQACYPYHEAVREQGSVPVSRFKELSRSVPKENHDHPRTSEVLSLHGQDMPEIYQKLGTVPLESFRPGDKFYCMEPFKTMYIRQDGEVKPCCFSESIPALGQSKTDDGLKIWEGDGYRAIREGILQDRYPMNLCKNCIKNHTGPQYHGVEHIIGDYIDWYRSFLPEDLFVPYYPLFDTLWYFVGNTEIANRYRAQHDSNA